MKNRGNKDRLRDRNEFVYMYRREISILLDKPAMQQRNFVDFIVRKMLPYSPKTASCDIWCSISLTYKELINNGIAKS